MPVTRYWLLPPGERPKIYSPHPTMDGRTKFGRARRRVWDRFYSLPSIWQRATCVKSLRAKVAFVLISKLYRQMYANTGIATDSARVARPAKRARLLAKMARRLFVAAPMPELEAPEAAALPAAGKLALRVIS